MAPEGSNGVAVPKSTTKPTFLLVLFHCTVVPTFTQKRALPFAFNVEGVAEAALAVRFTSTEHGVPPEPQVVACTHISWGFASLQANWLGFDWAVA